MSRFSSTNGFGTYYGELLYQGKRLLRYQEGHSQGYTTNWWSTGGMDDPSGSIVVFSGNQVARGTPGFRESKRPKNVQRG